jgi:hypothetical protein
VKYLKNATDGQKHAVQLFLLIRLQQQANQSNKQFSLLDTLLNVSLVNTEVKILIKIKAPFGSFMRKEDSHILNYDGREHGKN